MAEYAVVRSIQPADSEPSAQVGAWPPSSAGCVNRPGFRTPLPGPGRDRAAHPRLGLDRLGPGRLPDGWARSLLIRRDPDPADAGYAYFLCYHRQGAHPVGVDRGRRAPVGHRGSVSRSPRPRPGSTSTRSAAGPPGTATRSCPCSPRRSSPSPAPASRQTPPPGRRPDPLHLQRDPPATGNDRSLPSTGGSGSPCGGRAGDAATKPAPNCPTTGAAASCSTTPATGRSAPPKDQLEVLL